MSTVEQERHDPLEAARALLGLNEEPEPEDETEDEPDGGEDEDGEEEGEPAVAAFPSFQMQLPDELAEELALEEAIAVSDEEEESEDDGYVRDPELMKRLRAAEREAAFYRSQRLADGRKLWMSEAAKFFPLSEPFLDELPAESRRDFLRQAKALHVKLQPFWEERVQKPTAAIIEAEREKARNEARAAAEIAWGRPPGAMGAPSASQQAVERVNAARNQGDLVGTIKAMMGGPE